MLTVDPQSPLQTRERERIALREDELHNIVQRRDGERFERWLWEALEAGDKVAIRSIASAYLASPTTAPTSHSRERLALVGAAAHVQGPEPRVLRDLLWWTSRLEHEGLVLMRLAVDDLGRRQPGALDSAFQAATRRVRRIMNHVSLLARGRITRPGELVRELSVCGEFFLADAVARALTANGCGTYGTVAFAADVRHRWHHAERAVAMCDTVLSQGFNPAAANCKAASLGDLAQFEQAANVALVSLAYQSDAYSANTCRRALRNLAVTGRPQQRLELIVNADRCAILPPGYSGSPKRLICEQTTKLLAEIGARHPAEIPLGHVAGVNWARRLRRQLDATKPPSGE